jgi:ABC-type phosphate/phosphonate transport system ATPase subunit
VSNPEVLLADEPVSHLDRETALRTLDFIKAESRRNACTVLCALHDRELIERFADAVFHIDPSFENGWSIQPNHLH